MNNLVNTFLTFQSPEFWDTIEKCELEKERKETMKRIESNAKSSLEKFIFSLIVLFIIAFSINQIL